MTKDELEKIFVDVRKSYRLLYFYQRRVMDTIDFIANSLSKNVEYGWSLFSSNAPRNGSRLNLDRWSWDWLNMYCYEFHFGESNINSNKYQFAIIIESDSGWDDADKGVKETDVERFVSAEESFTRSYFLMGMNTWKPENFDDAWYKESDDEFESSDKELNQIFVSKRFDLSELLDEASIQNCLGVFKKFCESKGLGDYFN